MKFLYFTVFGCALVMFTSAIPEIIFTSAMPQKTYSTMYDHINVNNILKNDRLFNRYFTCLTKRGGCTPEGKLLAAAILDALETSCANCSNEQRKLARQVIQYL
uniref:Chemosensory protein 11 n=1 Tax=Laodelphax striatellus TaxID=195883 RepID=A0A096W1L1_LAOST|nr:chemosensory protein 11 [Laodelphax striatellus]